MQPFKKLAWPKFFYLYLNLSYTEVLVIFVVKNNLNVITPKSVSIVTYL